MKTKKIIKICLVIMLLGTFSSCGKEEVVLTGKLKVTYINPPTTYQFSISPVENTQVYIVYGLKLDNNGTFTYELNTGNYVLEGYGYPSYSYPYISKGFQIKAGETTEITLQQL